MSLGITASPAASLLGARGVRTWVFGRLMERRLSLQPHRHVAKQLKHWTHDKDVGVLKRRKPSFQGTSKDYRTTQREGNLCCEPRRGNVDLDRWARCGFRGLLVEPLVSKEQRDLSAWSVTDR